MSSNLILSELQKIREDMASVYDAISNKGGTIPSKQTLGNLASAINTIPQRVTPTGTISITLNGTYDVTAYATANVNVSGGTHSEGITYYAFKDTTNKALIYTTFNPEYFVDIKSHNYIESTTFSSSLEDNSFSMAFESGFTYSYRDSSDQDLRKYNIKEFTFIIPHSLSEKPSNEGAVLLANQVEISSTYTASVGVSAYISCVTYVYLSTTGYSSPVEKHFESNTYVPELNLVFNGDEVEYNKTVDFS